MSEGAPLWLCFIPQFVSVAGDCIGQRTARRYMTSSSRRRFLLGLVLVSSLQMFAVLTVIQLAAPATTTIIYETGKHSANSTSQAAYDWCSADLWPLNATGNKAALGNEFTSLQTPLRRDDRFDSANSGLGQTPTQEKYCFDQGPLSIGRDLKLCPMLLLNGVVNIFYYLGEATLYKQPLGVLLLVLTALASSFFIAPVQKWFHLSGATNVNVYAVLCGLVGAVLCLVERDPPKWKESPAPDPTHSDPDDTSDADGNARVEGGERKSLLNESQATSGGDETSSETSKANNAIERDSLACETAIEGPKWKRALKGVLSHLPLVGPFTMLSFAIVLYFVLMKYFNDECRINMWGYNSFDQVMLPLYIYPVFLVIDLVKPMKRLIEEEGIDQEESFREAFVGMIRDLFVTSKGVGFLHMFVYRLLINARAMGYSYIAIAYNLTDSYLELTLIRVILSWIASAVVILIVPSFILAQKREREKIVDKVNLLLKLVGTVAIVGSLIILNKSA